MTPTLTQKRSTTGPPPLRLPRLLSGTKKLLPLKPSQCPPTAGKVGNEHWSKVTENLTFSAVLLGIRKKKKEKSGFCPTLLAEYHTSVFSWWKLFYIQNPGHRKSMRYRFRVFNSCGDKEVGIKVEVIMPRTQNTSVFSLRKQAKQLSPGLHVVTHFSKSICFLWGMWVSHYHKGQNKTKLYTLGFLKGEQKFKK